MNQVLQRMLPATVLTLSLHGALLTWQMQLPETVLPKPPARKKISVSLKRLPPPAPPLKKIVREIVSPPEITPVEYEPIQPLPPVKTQPAPPKPVKKAKPKVQPKVVKKQVVRPKPKVISKPKPPPKPAPVKPAPPPRPAKPQPKLKKVTVAKAPPLPDIAPVTLEPIKPLPAPQVKKPIPRPELKNILPTTRSTPPPQPIQQVKPVVPRTTTYQRSQQVVKPTTQPVRRVQTVQTRSVQPVRQTKPVVRRTATYQRAQQPVRTTQPTRRVQTQPIQNVQTTTTRAKAPVSKSVTREATPLYQSNPPPKYPRQARRRGLEGTVTLAVTVLKDGSADKVRIHKSSGHRSLDKSALKTVKGWRFSPGTKNGQPAIMEVLVPVRFNLN